MKLKAKINGSSELLKLFDQYGKAGEAMVRKQVEINARLIERDAKEMAPVDHGTLRQNIKAQRLDQENWRITAYMPYSAYMEFGTGDLVSVPSELTEIAWAFKGAGIRKVNIAPQPYMHPAFRIARLQFPVDLEQGLDELAARFNNKKTAK